MRSVPVQKQRSPASIRTGRVASLSVVVVSSGVATAHRASQALKEATRRVPAQLIVVSQEYDSTLASIIERTGAEFVTAPAGSSRAAMCDLGMSCAHGSIVAVRDDVAVGDASWLDTYSAILPLREVVPPALESVVMDSQVVGRAVAADSASRYAPEPRAAATAIEMAAAI